MADESTTYPEIAAPNTRIQTLEQTLRAVYVSCSGIHATTPEHEVYHLAMVEIPSLVEAALPGETIDQMNAALRDTSLPPLPSTPIGDPVGNEDDIPF